MTALTEARCICVLSVPAFFAAVVSLVWGGQGRYAAFYGVLGCFLLLVGLQQGAKARRRIEKERTAARENRSAYSCHFDYWSDESDRWLGK